MWEERVPRAKLKATPRGKSSRKIPVPAEAYTHKEAKTLLRPDVGTQAQFRKKKPPKTYRYDSSLSPALDWDGGNAARELGEWLVGLIANGAALPPPHAFPEPQAMSSARGRIVEPLSAARA
jgi:adenine-specific DNA-methyltransferase